MTLNHKKVVLYSACNEQFITFGYASQQKDFFNEKRKHSNTMELQLMNIICYKITFNNRFVKKKKQTNKQFPIRNCVK